MNAFNYQTQKWESGAPAAVTRAKQLREEIALLESPRAAEYLRFIGQGAGKPATLIALNTAELARIEAEFPEAAETVSTGRINTTVTREDLESL